jgi:phage host-nuclease inhibitor protein Gam
MGTAVLPLAGPRADVAAKLRRMARIQTRLDSIHAEVERQLGAVRRRHERRMATLRQRLDAVRGELEEVCRTHRDDVFEEGRKSYRTPHGEVAFRKADVLVEVRDGLTDADVCRLLRRRRLARLVRTRESIDRQAVRRALAEGPGLRERLERCGLSVVEPPDHFRWTTAGGPTR